MRELEVEPSHILLIKPETDKTELSIDQVRELQRDVQVSFMHQVLVVLFNLDDSGAEVQNSLLKIIEEESHRLLFVFLVTDASRLLPTVLSRSTIVNSIMATSSHLKPASFTAESLFSLETNTDTSKEEALVKIDSYLNSGLITQTRTIGYILDMRNLLLNNNLNPVLTLDSILLFLLKQGTMKERHDKKK